MTSTKQKKTLAVPASLPVQQRRCVLVFGMHRAGTSALARVLSLRGAELPGRVLPANTGNPTGYWEPESVVQFNDRLLEYFGVEWNDPFATAQISSADAIPAMFAVRLISFFDEHRQNHARGTAH